MRVDAATRAETWLASPGSSRQDSRSSTWGDNSVSSCRSYRAAKINVLALGRARFLWRFHYPERIQGILDGVPRDHVRPPGPLGLAALARDRRRVTRVHDGFDRAYVGMGGKVVFLPS